jgi:hypothetical protein
VVWDVTSHNLLDRQQHLGEKLGSVNFSSHNIVKAGGCCVLHHHQSSHSLPQFLIFHQPVHTHKAKLRNIRFSGLSKSTKSLKKKKKSLLHGLNLAVLPIGMY